MQCSDCKFWHKGECRRYSPKVFVVERPSIEVDETHASLVDETIWPKTHGTEFCGDFEKKVLLKDLRAEEKLWSAVRRKVLGLV